MPRHVEACDERQLSNTGFLSPRDESRLDVLSADLAEDIVAMLDDGVDHLDKVAISLLFLAAAAAEAADEQPRTAESIPPQNLDQSMSCHPAQTRDGRRPGRCRTRRESCVACADPEFWHAVCLVLTAFYTMSDKVPYAWRGNVSTKAESARQ